jgi:hypothetical protein
MTTGTCSLLRTAGLALTLGAATLQAIDVDVTPREMEQILATARGPDAARAAFHAPYLLQAPSPVEALEVITERRRLALLAAERIAIGDPLFTQGTLRAEEALRPWLRKVAIVARFAFPVNNAYTIAPPVEIALIDPLTPRLDIKSETLFALPGANPAQPVPVVGARGEALFDAVPLARASRTIVVRLGDREVARVPIDFSQIE